MKKILQFVFVFYVLMDILHAYDISGQRAENLDTLFTDRKEADQYFHKYYKMIDAIKNGNLELVTELVEEIGAEAKVPYEVLFYSPLVHAVMDKKLEIVKYLLTHGAHPNYRMDIYDTGLTALMFAVTEDDPEIVDTLLEYGADANMVDANGDTALIHALGVASMGNEEIIKQLIPLSSLTKATKAHFTWGSHDRGKSVTPLTLAFDLHRSDVIIDALLNADATAGESDTQKQAFLKAFISYTYKEQNQQRQYKYCKVALDQVEGSTDATVEHNMIYLLATLYESALITGHTLEKSERQVFETLAQKYPKANAYKEMFEIIDASQKSSQKESISKWKKKYANLIKREWCFKSLQTWANSLPPASKYVGESVSTFSRITHP